MANNIDGPLYYERMGRTGPVMAFVHPNPMDQSCWIFQMAQMSTWFRCIAIDVPGYGTSMAMQRNQVDICAIWKIQHDWSIGLGCTKAITGPVRPIRS